MKETIALIDDDRNILTSISIALEKERVSQEKVGRNTKLIAEVSGQALFFDFKSMTLVANYPIEIALNHTINSVTVTQQDIQKLFDKLYFGSDEQAGFINHAVNIMANLQPNYSQGLRFQVASVSFSDKARQFLPDDLPPQRLSQFIGQYFSARLAKTKGLTVLPFTKGFAIGNQMSGRFANGDVFTLTLPDADYTFELSVLDFKKAPYKKNQVYAARLGLKLKEPLLKKTYVDGAFHYAVPKLVLAQNSLLSTVVPSNVGGWGDGEVGQRDGDGGQRLRELDAAVDGRVLDDDGGAGVDVVEGELSCDGRPADCNRAVGVADGDGIGDGPGQRGARVGDDGVRGLRHDGRAEEERSGGEEFGGEHDHV